MTQVFDVAVIGAGVVGSAIARELSRYHLKIALIESAPDVGMGTSKASTAIWHTGFDAKQGTLEAALMRRSYALMDKFMPEANIPHERLGAVLIAWNQEQLVSLPALQNTAFANGVMDVEIISAEDIYEHEPHINKGALGGLLVPGEGILCTFTVPLAYATQAVLNGVTLILNHAVKDITRDGVVISGDIHAERNDQTNTVYELDNAIRARYIVNAAGLFSDEINAKFGHANFTVTPRRGQLIIYDKLARPLVNHVLLPVPTSTTKGVLISPTVYGNILLGPTAEDLSDKSATETTADGLAMLIGKGREILPQLLDEEVTATYSGLRAATQHGDYQIEMHAEQHYLCVGGIRSTGVSAAMGIAEYAVELLRGTGLDLKLKDDFLPVKMPSIGQTNTRPYQNAALISQNPRYGEMICHCEKVSCGEVIDAMTATIPATSLDAIRRRTRASLGRCQGFNCHAALMRSLRSGTHLTTEAVRITEQSIKNAVHPAVAGVKDVLIVGAGPAGLSTAIELKKLGIEDVLVVDREPEAGGMPRMCHHTGYGRGDLHRMYSGPRYARCYREMAERSGVEILTSTTITGWNTVTPASSQEKRGLFFTSPNGLGEIEARAVLLATGARERPRAARMIPGTRPKGVFTTGSLQRCVYQEHLPVGKRAVIVGAELVSLSALRTLQHAGVKCAVMTTELPQHQMYFPYLPMKWILADILARTPIVTNTRVTNIFGRQHVEGIELTDANGHVEAVECDAVVFTGGWMPEHEMARSGGLTMDLGTHGPQVDAEFRSSANGVFAAGNLLRGVAAAEYCALEGRRAARFIARYLKSAQWPASRLEVKVEAPLAWVCPNVFTESECVETFLFRSDGFKKNIELQVQQGDRVLHTQCFRRLIVNEIMRFGGTWTRKVALDGDAVTVSVRK